MFAVAACTWLAHGNGQHWLHRDLHAWFQNGIDVFAQFQPGFAPVIMAENAETMAVAKGAVLQDLILFKKRVQFGSDFGAGCTGLQKADAVFMGGDIYIPDAAAWGVGFAKKKRAFECGVIARDHRKRVQSQDIAALQFA